MPRSIRGAYRPNPTDSTVTGSAAWAATDSSELRDAFPQEHLRVRVARHVADVRERGVQIATELLHRFAFARRVGVLGEQAHVDSHAHETLLGAVVEVPLDPRALEVHRVESPHTGPAQVAFQAEALHAEPDQPADRERQRQELERGVVEDRQHRDRHRHERDECDEDEPANGADRPTYGDAADGDGVLVVRVGPRADQHGSSPNETRSEGKTDHRGANPPKVSTPTK